jgi:hypothetical protein
MLFSDIGAPRQNRQTGRPDPRPFSDPFPRVTCYSLIETAKANALEFYEYLRHLLEHIAGADALEKIEPLLPWNIKRGITQEP